MFKDVELNWGIIIYYREELSMSVLVKQDDHKTVSSFRFEQDFLTKYLTCRICSKVFREPHRLHPCGHTFCRECIKGLKCINCKVAVKISQPDLTSSKLISDLTVKCLSPQCPYKGTFQDYRKNHQSNCQLQQYGGMDNWLNSIKDSLQIQNDFLEKIKKGEELVGQNLRQEQVELRREQQEQELSDLQLSSGYDEESLKEKQEKAVQGHTLISVQEINLIEDPIEIFDSQQDNGDVIASFADRRLTEEKEQSNWREKPVMSTVTNRFITKNYNFELYDHDSAQNKSVSPAKEQSSQSEIVGLVSGRYKKSNYQSKQKQKPREPQHEEKHRINSRINLQQQKPQLPLRRERVRAQMPSSSPSNLSKKIRFIQL